jgi:hypothetical protein
MFLYVQILRNTLSILSVFKCGTVHDGSITLIVYKK